MSEFIRLRHEENVIYKIPRHDRENNIYFIQGWNSGVFAKLAGRMLEKTTAHYDFRDWFRTEWRKRPEKEFVRGWLEAVETKEVFYLEKNYGL